MIDLQLFNLINGLAGKSRVLDLLGIFLADYLGYFLILLALYLIFSRSTDWRIRYQSLLFTVLALILARGILTEIIRFFYNRPRPFAALEITPLLSHEAVASFPSGHAAFYFALALAVFYFLDRSWGWKLIGAAFLIGLARVFVGIHWPLDIVGGLVMALLSVWLIITLFPKRTFS